ncbi:excinuclease ABC subunit C [Salinisphaera orenii MK-B5]|uniref:UvrABC system protein C n=2 Tax=Salinisphaera orenii TaxID=856731 RepID=A0A423PXI8_9GAMM|nr:MULTISPECIES: excinuclease ABC subunit UvrC [Salinisphaera]ROO26682.1 excinuclease ABC subunit C [Salinisphaera halophila YIM 95161]ROO30294.1 excinuclease ABC subunit C [Salinisphaera orenii MK-B5]
MTTDTGFDPNRYVRQLTQRPGVYRMYDAEGTVLYVGKAKNLKKRVSSYFLRASGNAKTESMLDQVADIEVTITHTEDEALLLESTLIKRHRPRYNVYLRDDKSYPYLLITGDNDFPRVVYHRGAQKREGHYFGPFPSSGAVRQTQDTLMRLFKLRNCRDSFFENRTRPCLQYQIKRCTAPCVGYISQEDYARDVRDAVELLQGRNEKLIDRLVGDMEAASAALDFETAAHLREKIAALRRLQSQSQTVGGQGDFDILCAAIDGGVAAVVVVTVRGGINLGHRSFFPNAPAGTEVADMMAAFVSQYYLDRRPPPELLIDPLPSDDAWLAESLSQRAGRKVAFKPRVRGERRRWLDNTRATLEQTLSAQLASRAGVEKRLAALADALGLETPPMQMACFDISHTRGERAVASCVVFEGGAPNKSAYRRFNIDGIEPGDDYAAMRQALTRRFKRVRSGEAPLPDLLLIDGGKGQLAVARETLAELGIEGVQLLGVAKGATRKPGLEQLFLPGDNAPLILPADSPALHLIQQIRDEAHRFAIAAHRGQRGKARSGSMLDDVEGLGPKRRKKLLQTFGGPRQVARAGVAELARVDGISARMAQRIYDHFHDTA